MVTAEVVFLHCLTLRAVFSYCLQCVYEGVKYFVLGKECMSGAVSINVFFVLCDVCRWWYGVQDAGVMPVWCVCYIYMC